MTVVATVVATAAVDDVGAVAVGGGDVGFLRFHDKRSRYYNYKV